MLKSRREIEEFLPRYLPFVIFFAGSFIFFGFVASYIEFYQEKSSLFIFSGEYLTEYISRPGGLIVYTGRFLTSFFYYPAAGAVVISGALTSLAFFVSLIIKRADGKFSVLAGLIVGSLFFMLQANYHFLFYNTLAILLQIIFFRISARYFRGFLPVILFPVWYWITGGFAWLFLVLYSVQLIGGLVKMKWIKIILIYGGTGLSGFLLKEYLIFENVHNLLVYPVTDEATGSQLNVFIGINILIVIFYSISIISLRFRPWITKIEGTLIYFVPVFTLTIVCLISVLSYSKDNREFFYAERLFFNRRFTELTNYITKHPTNNKIIIFLNNIALSETGRLNDLLFHYPQSKDGETLFLKWGLREEVLRTGGYFYYTTGIINEAHRWAFENMVMKGYTPEDLKMLIKTEIISSDYKMASKYISLLGKTLFYRSEARAYSALLNNDRAVESHPELGDKRKYLIKNDFFVVTDNPYINIERLLINDSLNRKAFEYKLAYLMITKDIKSLSAEMKRLTARGFDAIPIHLQEAALVCNLSDPSILLKIGNLKVTPQVAGRFDSYLSTFRLYGNNPQAARPALKQKFGDTFWYWAFYN